MLPEDYTTEEIQRIVQFYAAGAKRAKKAGLDGVELHGAHAHEIAQFLSPFYNKREDRYGRDLEGRSRFPLEIVRSIKQVTGKDFPVIFRLSVEERIPGGRELPETLQLVRLLEEAGADALHTSVGMPDSQHWLSAPMDVPPGFTVHLASKVKEVVSIPVIAVGRINDISLAARIINEGHADFVSMGRSLLADPDLPKKAFEGKMDQIRGCIGCNQGCHSKLVKETMCLQNPRTGRENVLFYADVSPEERKTVLIVGAGPAGMEAACVLSERGHRVKLYEQKTEIGGTFLLAAKPPKKEGILEVIRYRKNRLKELGVEINLNKKVDLKLVLDVHPDVVIVATGGYPAIPPFPTRGKEIYHADEVLLGKSPGGERMLVIGGGMVGCEVAEYLADKGYRVDIVEQLSALAEELDKARRFFLLERLDEYGVNSILGAKVLEVNLPRVKVSIQGREKIIGDYDSVVLAIGRQPNLELMDSLENCHIPIKVVTIGDAASTRTGLEAIHKAALATAQI
jgi:NADPH-dependent 2,4-dienoyl-CoA reductase/sulfur reductase-like enzyme